MDYSKELNNQDYYVKKADKQGFTVTWTNNYRKSMMFHTKMGCQHFVQAYLGNRSDIQIKMIKNEISG